MKALKFWKENPALLYGLALLLGALYFLQTPLALIPLLFLLLSKKHVFIVTLLFLLPLAYLHQCYFFPPSGTAISGCFTIKSVREMRKFTKGWSYLGSLSTKQGWLTCRVQSKTYFPADKKYQITGSVKTQNGRFYTLKATSWQPIEGSFCIAQLRYLAKKWSRGYIERHIKQKRSAAFITGMAIGELEDPVMLQEFGSLGLSHIMAISGFHFALVTLAFHLILSLFLSHKIESLFLIVILTLYMLFIGDSPSVQRAWIVAMVFLLGQLWERPTQPLNSLGFAILLSILLNPLSVTTLSFQLSFLATGGILLLYQPMQALLLQWVPKLTFKEVVERHLLWQHGYVLAGLVREGIALSLAVHLALLPLLLYFFHAFPLSSLIYNLFFPFCAGLALLLFILGILTGGLLHPLNGWYCEHLLSLTESPPLQLKTVYVESISPVWMTLYLTLLFVFSIWWKSRDSGEECNTKTQRHEGTKRGEISHQIIGAVKEGVSRIINGIL